VGVGEFAVLSLAGIGPYLRPMLDRTGASRKDARSIRFCNGGK
jgi:hypothetical protein